ncbi:hypothetical protein JCM8097_001823 [Rhodosporidiobolus ruineniae]
MPAASTSTTSTAAALEGLIASLPAGTNPYTAVDAYLWSTMDKQLPRSFFIQLWVLVGGLAFNLVEVLLALVLLVVWRRFWVFRFENGAIKPNGQTPWLIGGGAFYIIAIYTIVRSISYYRGKELVRELIGLRTMMWWFPWTGGWIAAHSLAAGFVNHLQSVGSLSTSAAQSWHRRLTVFFYTVLALFFASAAPFCVIAVIQYHRSLDAFGQLDGLVKQAAAPYNGTFDMSSLSVALPLLETVQSEQKKLVHTLKILYTMYGAWGIVLGLGVGLSALFHTRSLNRTLKRAEGLKLSGSIVTDPGTSRRTAGFRKTYRMLVFIMWAFSAICSGFTAVSFYVGFRTEDAMNNKTAMQAVDLTMYWLYFFAGAPVGGLVLFRLLRSQYRFRAPQSFTFGHSSSNSCSADQINDYDPSSRKPASQSFAMRLAKRKPGAGSAGAHGVGSIAVDVSTVVAVHTLDTPPNSSPRPRFHDVEVDLDDKPGYYTPDLSADAKEDDLYVVRFQGKDGSDEEKASSGRAL